MKSMAAALLINVVSEHPNITSDLRVGLVDLKKILEIDFTDYIYVLISVMKLSKVFSRIS